MRFAIRSDLGGRAATLPALTALAGIEIERPMVMLAGGNGCGKSSLFAALRQATGLVGQGAGRYPEYPSLRQPLAIPRRWGGEDDGPIDLAKHALMLEDSVSSWMRDKPGMLPEDAVGVLDPVAMGWCGQRVWLHDGRAVDDHSSCRSSMNLTAMRRSADDLSRSHGQQMAGRLRYAAAWGLGLIEARDNYDRADGEFREYDLKKWATLREIFTRLSGVQPTEVGRTEERWLLLDEPETGLDPAVLASLLAMLAEGAAVGRMRVFCATHSSLAMALAHHRNVQVIDLDGYAARMESARMALSDTAACAALAADEEARLAVDAVKAVAEDRGLRHQQRHTAHEAMSIPYPEAVVAPYGNPDCLNDMRGAKSR